jgi:hypothetical protein
MTRPWRLAAIAGFVVGTGGGTAVLAQSFKQEDPIPATPSQTIGAIERSFTTLRTHEPLALFPRMKEQLQDAPAFLRDSKAGINFRSYFRDIATDAPTGSSSSWKEAWAAGGSFNFETGRLLDLISGGLVLYTSLPIYAPLDRDGTQLLRPGQLSYGVLGQLYGKVHLNEQNTIVAGRYLYDTPFIGPQDNRMSPNTFYGYTLMGSYGEAEGSGPFFRYGGGYIAAIKQRNSTEFVSMSRAAGANDDRGVSAIGGLMRWGPVHIGAIEYYAPDTMSIFYTEGKVGHELGGTSMMLQGQFAAQSSVGANLLNAGTYWATSQLATQLQVGYSNGILTAAYSAVNPGFTIQTPWSANPFYTDAQILSFNRAGESAIMLGLSYVMTPIGLPGVAASAFYFRGWTSAPAAGAPLLEDEWNLKLEWRPGWKPLNGLWLRAQYGQARTDQSGSQTTVNEVRLILNYGIKLY